MGYGQRHDAQLRLRISGQSYRTANRSRSGASLAPPSLWDRYNRSLAADRHLGSYISRALNDIYRPARSSLTAPCLSADGYRRRPPATDCSSASNQCGIQRARQEMHRANSSTSAGRSRRALFLTKKVIDFGPYDRLDGAGNRPKTSEISKTLVFELILLTR